MEVHLVADTNLFFECKSLEQLPWSELGFDSVVILLTKPVLDEIDKHKKANGRTRARALDIFSRVRTMLKQSVQEIEICAPSPRVVIRLIPNVVPDAALKEGLDYSKTDERLIGIVSTLNAQASGYGVKLFTDDTGPATSASGLSVPFIMIEESWRRPASETTEEKKIKDLEKDLATYRSQEPRIVIRPCEPGDSDNLVEVIRKVAQPLTEAEIESFLAVMKLKHPLVTDFTPPPSSTTKDQFGGLRTTEYTSPSEADILNYREVAYPRWIVQCRGILAKLHEGRDEIEQAVVLRWAMANEGTRPASHVRVKFQAKGSLALRRIGEEEDVTEAYDAHSETSAAADPRFPSAPRPPPFQQHVTNTLPPTKPQLNQRPDVSLLKASGLFDTRMGGLSDLAKLMGNHDRLAGLSAIEKAARGLHSPSHSALEALRGTSSITSMLQQLEPIRVPKLYIPKQRDPEEFCYDWPSGGPPVEKGALTCELWR